MKKLVKLILKRYFGDSMGMYVNTNNLRKSAHDLNTKSILISYKYTWYLNLAGYGPKPIK